MELSLADRTLIRTLILHALRVDIRENAGVWNDNTLEAVLILYLKLIGGER